MKILIATSGDDYSAQAVRLGKKLPHAMDCTITLLTVIDDERELPQAKRILREASSTIKPACGAVRTKVRVGEHAAEILEETETEYYDLLIVGAHPSYSFLKRILGTTIARLMGHAPCPVLIAKGEARPLHHILVCSSGAVYQHGPSQTVSELAPILPAGDLTLLHVMSQISASPAGPEGWQLHAGAEELIEEHTAEGRFLEKRAQLLRKAGFQVQAKVRHGLVVDEIVAEAESGDYDLVVIGSHGISGWKHYLLEDVAQQVVDQLDRPILVA